MAIRVMKFGGSSLETDDQIHLIAGHIIKEQAREPGIVAVVSARGRLTDEILETVRRCGGKTVANKLLDFAGPAGEAISAACLAGAIEQGGIETIVADGRRIRLIATGQFGEGRVKRLENPSLITKALDERKIVVLAAYAGITIDGEPITLGRGGSDTFAVAVAAATKAKVCRIYTDVPGIFAVDPRFVQNAKMLSHITYWQAMELCSAGAQVLKERCIQIAAGLSVPLQVLLSPSFDASDWQKRGIDVEDGTWLSSGASLEDMEAASVEQTGLAIRDNITVFNIVNAPNRPGISAEIFGACKNIIIGDIAQSLTPKGSKAIITFYVRSYDEARVRAALGKIDLGKTKIECREDLACLMLIDPRLVTESGWVARATKALANGGINIESHPTSGDKISLLVVKDKIEQAAQALAEEFDLCT